MMICFNMTRLSDGKPNRVKQQVFPQETVSHQAIAVAFDLRQHIAMKVKFDIGPILDARDISQNELANGIGVAKGYISNIAQGKKLPSYTMTMRITDYLGMTSDELFAAMKGDARGAAVPQRPGTGFAEPEATPFQWPTKTSEARLYRALAPTAQRPSSLLVNRAIAEWGILRGDIVIIDLGREARSGDLVAATLSDAATDEHTTLMRRLALPWLVGPLPSDELIHTDEAKNRSVTDMRPIVGVARGAVPGA